MLSAPPVFWLQAALEEEEPALGRADPRGGDAALRRIYADAVQKLETAQRRLAHADTERHDLAESLRQERDKAKRLQLQLDNANATGEFTALELRQKLEAVQKRLIVQEVERGELEDSLKHERGRDQGLQAELKDTASACDKSIAEVQHQRLERSQSSQDLRHELIAAKAKRDEMGRHLEEERHKTRRYELRLDAVTAERDTALDKGRAQLEALRKFMEGQIQSEELSRSLEREREVSARLKDQVDAFRSEHADALARHDRVDFMHQQLQSSLSSRDTQLHDVEHLLAQECQRSHRFQAQCDNATSERDELLAREKRLQGQFENVLMERDDLLRREKRALQEYDRLRHDLSQEHERSGCMEAQIEVVTKERDELMAQGKLHSVVARRFDEAHEESLAAQNQRKELEQMLERESHKAQQLQAELKSAMAERDEEEQRFRQECDRTRRLRERLTAERDETTMNVLRTGIDQTLRDAEERFSKIKAEEKEEGQRLDQDSARAVSLQQRLTAEIAEQDEVGHLHGEVQCATEVCRNFDQGFNRAALVNETERRLTEAEAERDELSASLKYERESSTRLGTQLAMVTAERDEMLMWGRRHLVSDQRLKLTEMQFKVAAAEGEQNGLIQESSKVACTLQASWDMAGSRIHEAIEPDAISTSTSLQHESMRAYFAAAEARRGELVQGLKHEFVQSLEEMKHLNDDQTHLTQSLERERAERDRLQVKLRSETDQRDELEQSMEKECNAQSLLQTKLRDVTLQRDELEQRLVKKCEEKSLLQTQLQNLSLQRDDMASREALNVDSRLKLKEMQRRFAEAQADVCEVNQRLTQERARTSCLQSELKASRMERDKLKARLSVTENQLIQMQAQRNAAGDEDTQSEQTLTRDCSRSRSATPPTPPRRAQGRGGDAFLGVATDAVPPPPRPKLGSAEVADVSEFCRRMRKIPRQGKDEQSLEVDQIEGLLALQPCMLAMYLDGLSDCNA
mmetsp:Transcript_137164/g.293002  ORF Transcript_137164/g.293002 Transcript_137164/m.293002 type:complete len:976 (+) Transcript_137164:75-3002(+)